MGTSKIIPGDSLSAATGFPSRNGSKNKLLPQDQPVHEWYRFVLSFPPHLVENYIGKFGLRPRQTLLDPFCGTGTTLVTGKMRGLKSIGVEANPMAHFASEVKVDWNIDPEKLIQHAYAVADSARQQLDLEDLVDDPFFCVNSVKGKPLRALEPAKAKLLLRDSISPLPLHKALILIETLRQNQSKIFHRHELLALAKALVFSISNLRFGPEVGIGKPKTDTPVIAAWLSEIDSMARDLLKLRGLTAVPATVHLADARSMSRLLSPRSVDAVITSPPYPNEKDYTRTTRLESVLLGFINSPDELRAFKRQLVRSNTRTVYKGDDDDQWVRPHPEIERLAETIEKKRIALGKTSGFERLYPRVTRLYFGGMARHLFELQCALKPGAQLAYVVGDQASYLRVMIRTGQLLAEIAESLGYEVVGIDLFRTRLATATKEQLREEVVVLRWPGTKK